MTYESEKERKSVRIPIFILMVVIGVFLSLIATVYGLTLQPLKDADAQTALQIISLQNKNITYDATLSKLSANILLLCNAQGVKCVQ